MREPVAIIVDVEGFLSGAPARWRSGRPRRVWYFGDDHERWLAVRAATPPGFEAMATGALLTDAALRTTDVLIDLDRQLLRHEWLRWVWDGGQLSDRGPYASPAQTAIARTLVFLERVSGGGDHLFVVEDADFGRALAAVARRNGFEAAWSGSARGWFDWARHLRAVVTLWRAVTRDALGRLRLARRERRIHPAPLAALRDCDALLVVWAGSTTFPAGVRCETNPFLGRLPSLLRAAGYRVGFLALPLYWTEYYGGILANTIKAGDPVLTFEDVVTAGDLWRSLATQVLTPLAVRRRLSCAGFDMSPLVAGLLRANALSPAPVLAGAHAAIGRGLAAAGIRPRVIYHAHENQPWERRLRAGLRRHLPGTRVDAVQVSLIGDLFLGLLPSRAEIAADRLPDRLLVPGERFRRLFVHHGFPLDRVVVGGALRYEKRAALAPPTTTRVVLCATSIEVDESLELLLKTVGAVSLIGDCRLLVNFHPSLERSTRARIMERLEAATGGRLEALDVVEGAVVECLPDAAVVVYNASGVVIDAVAMGRPAIYVGRDCAIDHDKAPTGVSFVCRSVEELATRLLLSFQDPSPPDREAVLGAWVGPVDPALVIGAGLDVAR